MSSLSKPMVEIYRRGPECTVCGGEIVEGREEYHRGQRVCSGCKEDLKEAQHEARTRRAAAGPVRRG